MFERSEFVSLPAWRIALTGTRRAASCGRLSLLTFFGEAKKVSSRRAEGVCACKRIPLRRRIACDPNSLLHPPGKPPRRTNRLVFSKGIRREALRLSTPTFSISMQISLPSDPLAYFQSPGIAALTTVVVALTAVLPTDTPTSTAVVATATPAPITPLATDMAIQPDTENPIVKINNVLQTFLAIRTTVTGAPCQPFLE